MISNHRLPYQTSLSISPLRQSLSCGLILSADLSKKSHFIFFSINYQFKKSGLTNLSIYQFGKYPALTYRIENAFIFKK